MLVVNLSRLSRALATVACAGTIALCALPAAAQYTVSEGTQISAVLATSDIDTKTAQIGDGFTMDIVQPYPEGNPDFANAVVRGHVSDVVPGGQGRAARLKLAFDSIVFPDGTSVPISANVMNQTAKPTNTTAKKGLAAAIGAAIGSQTIGRIIGGSAGSVVGLLGGAAGGFFYAANDKPNLDLARGTAVNLQTDADILVPRRQAGQ